MKYFFTVISALMLLVAMMSPVHAAKKCADFRTQAQAQAHYKKLKRANKTGWKSLDRNKDGVACECLKSKTCSKGKKKGFFSKKKANNTSDKKAEKKSYKSKKDKKDNKKAFKKKSKDYKNKNYKKKLKKSAKKSKDKKKSKKK